MSALFDAFPSPSVELLLDWLRTRDIFLDDRLEVRATATSGWAVFARDAIEPEESVCRIPKRAMLSHRTSSLPFEATASRCDLTPPTHILALHVLHEILLGAASPFYGYLQSLPREVPPLAMLWEPGLAGKDGTRAWALAKDGEIGWSLRRSECSLGTAMVGGKEVEWGAGGLSSLKTFHSEVALPTLSASNSLADELRAPSFDTFLHAYAIVSSRCFTIDTFHHIALVPLADIFNHSPGHDVHFAVDEFTCSSCGSLVPCMHDSIPKGSLTLPLRLSHLHELREADLLTIFGGVDSGDIYTNAPIEAGAEVFNTYGNLSSAHLACEYGFVPGEAGTLPEDRIHFDLPPLPSPLRASLFAGRPHPLIESLSAAAHLPPGEKAYVSADGQVSEELLLVCAHAANLSGEEAVAVVHDGGEFEEESWERLRAAVVALLDGRLAGYETSDALFAIQEDESTGPITHMAATLALVERTTLDACRAQWVDEPDELSDETGKEE